MGLNGDLSQSQPTLMIYVNKPKTELLIFSVFQLTAELLTAAKYHKGGEGVPLQISPTLDCNCTAEVSMKISTLSHPWSLKVQS